MTESTLSNLNKPKYLQHLPFIVMIGVVLGIIAALVKDIVSGVISAAVLAGIFGAYNNVLRRSNGILNGFAIGGLLGIIVGAVGYLLGGTIDSILNGTLFGLSRGLLIGAVIGIVSHAEYQDDDSLFNKLFLVIGSIGLGAILGGGVGLITGTLLGIIGKGIIGKISAAIIGGIVGGYIGSYYKDNSNYDIRAILTGAVTGIILALLSAIWGGAFAGVILGALSGSVSPMLWVASIAAVGGLTSRGVMAMIVEALEAPSEMLEQGAVPFLVPAIIAGGIIGTAASGVGGLIALPVSLAIIGLTFGALGDMDNRPHAPLTMRSIVEMAMMGAEEWPIGRVILQVTGANRRAALIGASLGAIIGLVTSLFTFYLVQFLVQVIQDAI